jgi:hypothetical protein
LDVLEFNRRFMRIEEELALFPDTRVAEPGWWDVVRHDVMKQVYGELSGVAPDAPTSPSFATRLRHLATRLVLRIDLEVRMWLGRYDVLVYRAPRLVREGRRVDTGLDQVIAACPGRKLVINTFPHRYDRGYARAGQVAPRPAPLDALERRLSGEFGIPVDLDELVRKRLADFEIGRRRYARVLARVQPRLVLLNQNGIEKALFRATREAGIPCLEAQHGLINAAHPGYAYPASVHSAGRAMFPNVMFAFSQYWIDGCHYPARHRIAIGNDAFHPIRMPPTPLGGAVLVISALKYHETLIRWLRETAPHAPARRFLYKLHPAQASSLVGIQAELADLPNVTVHGTDVTVQSLLGKSSEVLLIQSTVAYEAVQAGRRLLIIPELDYATHSDLMTLDGVEVVKDAAALLKTLAKNRMPRSPPRFFEPFDAARATRILELLLRTGEPFAPAASATPSVIEPAREWLRS